MLETDSVPRRDCLILYQYPTEAFWVHAAYVAKDSIETIFGNATLDEAYYRSIHTGERLDPACFIACAELPEAR
jgi:hypothetical protein